MSTPFANTNLTLTLNCQGDGTPWNLSGASALLKWLAPDGVTQAVVPATVLTGTTGAVTVTLSPAQTAQVGAYQGQLVITDAQGNSYASDILTISIDAPLF